MDPHADPALEVKDRAVRRAVAAADAWHARLGRDVLTDGVEDQPPLGRHRAVAGKTAYDELGARDGIASEAEWRAALRRWVGALAVQRVTEEARLEEARAETERSAHVRLERRTEDVSFRAAWKGLVASGNAAEGAAWMAALEERGPAVAAARRERAAREEEACLRLGAATPAALVEAPGAETAEAAAHAFLARTSDLARAVRGERRGEAEAAVGVILGAEARDAREGWPARLTLRALVETLHAPGDIGRGLVVRVHLPEPVGAASFARALAAFGEAYRRAAASASRLPFALAVDPHFVDAHRFGLAFGALAAQPVYHRRGLGVSPGVASDQARALARTALLHARGIAVAALLSRVAARPSRSQFEEITAELYGVALPATLTGAFPRPTGAELARLEALLSTLPFLELLRDRFEDDWFRNPRAWAFLRGRAAGPARGVEVDAALAPEAPEALARAFERALG